MQFEMINRKEKKTQNRKQLGLIEILYLGNYISRISNTNIQLVASTKRFYNNKNHINEYN